MNITNLPFENDEYLLYVSDEYMELNEESVDIYLTKLCCNVLRQKY